MSVSQTGIDVPPHASRREGMVKLNDLCHLGGFELERDADVASLGFVKRELDARLVYVADEANAALANSATGVAAILMTPDLMRQSWRNSLGLAVATDPRRAFIELHNRLSTETSFYGTRRPTEIDQRAHIHPTAHVDECGVIVGPDCHIAAGATLLEGTRLGQSVRVLSGAVLGATGFQTMKFDDIVLDFRHAGSLTIEDRTSVMANAVVARSPAKRRAEFGTASPVRMELKTSIDRALRRLSTDGRSRQPS